MDVTSIIKNKINLLHQRLYYYPSGLQIGITNKCNLQCIMCKRRSIQQKYPAYLEKEMSFEDFKYIVDQFPKIKKIRMTGLGENLLNKDFLKMLRYIKEKKIYVEFFDNFYFLDDKIAEQLINIGVDKVYASIDGATKETYEKIRIGSSFERVMDNIKGLINLKKKKRANYPEITFIYVINRYNSEEVLNFIDIVNSIIDNEKASIRLVDMANYNGNQKHLCLKKSTTKKIIFQAAEKSKRLGIILDHAYKIKKSIASCQQWLMPFIVPRGYVFPCCSAPNGTMYIGNIFKKSFKQIWDSEDYKNFRKDICHGKTPSFCKKCELYCEKVKYENSYKSFAIQ